LNHAETSDLFSVVFVHPWFFFSLLIFVSSFFVFSSLGETEDEKNTLKYENIWVIGRLYKYRIVLLSFIMFFGIIFFSFSIVLDKIKSIRSLNLPIHQITYNKNDILKCVVNIGSTSTSLFYWDVNSLEAVIIPKKQIVKISVILPEPPAPQGRGRQRPPRDGSKTEYQKTIELWANNIKEKCH